MKKPVRRLSDWFFRPYHISYQKITGGYNSAIAEGLNTDHISYQKITGGYNDQVPWMRLSGHISYQKITGGYNV